MPVTIKQIAARSGLSIPTVSQVLNNKGHRYRPQTCRKVLKAVRDLGYRPNSFARAIRMGRFNCAALLLSTERYRSFLPNELLRGVHDGLAERDLHLTLTVLPDEKLTSHGFVPKFQREWMADGLLINYNVHVPRGMTELIREYGVPSIWINTKLKSDCVFPDDFAAGRSATELLLRLGHRRIAYADYGFNADRPADHYSADDRRAGCAAAMQEAGGRPRFIHGGTHVPPRERAEFSVRWLAKAERPSAVVTYSDTTALPILHAAASLGLAVPRDLSIITFCENVIDTPGVAVTTMLIPWYDVGRAAARMLLQKIQAPKRALRPQPLPFSLGEGQTCAPPGSSEPRP